MQVAVWLAIAILLLVWTFWPSGHRPPVLLVVRDRVDEVEGVVRALRGAGHEVLALDQGSSDATQEVLQRLSREGSASSVGYGAIDQAVTDAEVPVLLVVRLDDHFTARDALQALRIGR